MNTDRQFGSAIHLQIQKPFSAKKFIASDESKLRFIPTNTHREMKDQTCL